MKDRASRDVRAESWSRRAAEGEPGVLAEMLAFLIASDGVIVWGCGKFGRVLHAWLESAGVRILARWDMREGAGDGLPFQGAIPGESAPIVVTMADPSAIDEAVRECARRGHPFVLDGRALYMAGPCPAGANDSFSFKQCFDHDVCANTTCPKLNAHMRARGEEGAGRDYPVGHPTIVTGRICNLRCVHCNQELEEYERGLRVHFEAEKIVADARALAACFRFVPHMTVHGGEVFLHRELPRIVDGLLGLPNVGFFVVVTNGALRIPDASIEACARDRIFVLISDYGPHITDAQRALVRENLAKFRERGVAHRLLWNADTWEDMSTQAERRSASVPELEDMFSKCGWQYPPLVDGKLYRCQVTPRLELLHGLVLKADYVDLRGPGDAAAKRDEMNALFEKKHLESCAYCKFPFRDLGVAGIQKRTLLKPESLVRRGG